MDPKDDHIKYLSFNWFRDNTKHDISISNGISLGETLAPVFWQELSSIARYYLEFKEVVKDQNEIILPEDASRLRRHVAKVSVGDVSYGPRVNQYQNDEVEFGKRDLPVAPLARLFRAVQISSRLLSRHRKTLFISTWVTRGIARENKHSFVLFRKSLLRGAAPIYKSKYIGLGKNVFPATIDEYISVAVVEATLLKIDVTWEKALVELCVEHARKRYTEMREDLIRNFALYTDLLKNYEIDICYLPEDSIPSWSILVQICKLSGIKSRIFTDGYSIVPFAPLGRDETGDGWLVDEVAAYGNAHKEMVVSLGFPEKQIFVIDPPFAKLQVNNFAKYDFIVMSWFANCLSISGDHLSPISTMMSALDVVVRAGAKSVGIKIKTQEERKYIEPLVKELPISVEILEGRFYEHVNKAKAVVGGISTAVAECAIAGVPYFIFEPHENGYSDELIDKSLVIQLEKIARTPDQLGRLIEAGESSWTAPLSELIGNKL